MIMDQSQGENIASSLEHSRKSNNDQRLGQTSSSFEGIEPFDSITDESNKDEHVQRDH